MQPPGDSFYIRLRGKTSGPYSKAQLRRMHEQGQLTPFHEVSDDGNRWALASDLGFILSGGPPPLPGGDHGLGLPTPSSAAPPQRWYLLDQNDRRQGPMTREQIQQMARQGAIPPTHLVWCEGWPDWVPLNQTDLSPAPVYYSGPTAAPMPMPMPAPMSAPMPAPRSAPAPAPMPRQAPQPAPVYAPPRQAPEPRVLRPVTAPPQPQLRQKPAQSGSILTSWVFGVVVGLFLMLVGCAFLGLAVIQEQEVRSQSKGPSTKAIDPGTGRPVVSEDDVDYPVAKASKPDRTIFWAFAATGGLFIVFGLVVVVMSWRRRPKHE